MDPLGKRLLDLGVGTVALMALLPVMFTVALAVRLGNPGPVLFRQTRIGRHEVPFTILKFRTMHVDCDDAASRAFNAQELAGAVPSGAEDGLFKLAHDPRITPVGRWLRRFSLDELPQLLNVVRGEMSLVGPRPSLPLEVTLYTPEQRRRHDCRPGMTGLWQVSGRNRLSMPEMLALDLLYREQRSLRLDLAILLRTPAVMLAGCDTR